MANQDNVVFINNFIEGEDLVVMNAGFQKKTSHSFGPYTDNCHILQYIIDGAGTLIINNEEYHLSKGDLFYLPANVTCEYFSDDTNPYEYYWVTFIGKLADSLLHKCQLSPQIPVCHPHSSEIQNLFARLFRNIQYNKPTYSCRIISDLYAIFACLEEENNSELPIKIPEIIAGAITFMTTNYQYGITVNDVCEHVHLNLSYFSKLFKKQTGYNPSKYLMGLRMTNGAMLLKTTDLSIKDIAIQIGMTSLEFTHAFKKQYNFTPKLYRAQSKKSIKL